MGIADERNESVSAFIRPSLESDERQLAVLVKVPSVDCPRGGPSCYSKRRMVWW